MPAGIARIIPPLARASIAAGADGVAVEVHPHPEQARSALWEASAFADSSRALVERTAARADLDEALLRALVLRLKAARESDLGPR